MQVDLGKLFPGQIAFDRNRREAGGRVNFADNRPPTLQCIGQQATQQVQCLVQILGLVTHHQHAEARPVARNRHPVTVFDQTTRRRHQTEIELVTGRKRGILLGLEQLQLRQSAHQQTHAGKGCAPEDNGTAQEQGLPFVDVGKEQLRFAAHRNLTSLSSNF